LDGCGNEAHHNNGTASPKHTPTIDQSMSNSAIYRRLGMQDSPAAATSAIYCQLSQTNLRDVEYCTLRDLRCCLDPHGSQQQ
jgi:hypothetical protein